MYLFNQLVLRFDIHNDWLRNLLFFNPEMFLPQLLAKTKFSSPIQMCCYWVIVKMKYKPRFIHIRFWLDPWEGVEWVDKQTLRENMRVLGTIETWKHNLNCGKILLNVPVSAKPSCIESNSFQRRWKRMQLNT